MSKSHKTPRRIAIVSSLLHPSYGGPAQVVKQHVHAMRQFCTVDVIGTALPHLLSESRQFMPGSRIFETDRPYSWFRSRSFADYFNSAVFKYDLVHIHMVWDYPVWIAARAAASAGRPYVLTPHGTFMAPWRYRSLKKRLYRKLFLGDVLNKAAAIHVLSDKERLACWEAGITAPTVVIPNSLSNEAFRVDSTKECPEWLGSKRTRMMVYLGRLWHEKGLDLLVEAWSCARRKGHLSDWKLVVAGADFRGYREKLERQIRAVSADADIVLIGEVHGQDKAELLQFADAFVLPSRSEAMSVALLEAMAAGLPCLYTKECNLPDLADFGGGIEVNSDVVSLEDGLVRIAGLTQDCRLYMGRRARRMALERFSQDYIMKNWDRLYGVVIDRSF